MPVLAHITRSQTRTVFGGIRHILTAQIDAPPHDRQLIAHSGLGHMEVFHDPLREAHDATASAAHDQAKARGLFVTSARDVAAVAGAEMRSIVATLRALRAFNCNVDQLLRGVKIQHKSLQAITEIEAAIIAAVDRLDHFLAAARGYAETSEDIFTPGTDDQATVPPADWPRTWTP